VAVGAAAIGVVARGGAFELAVGRSEVLGLGEPEVGTLEARLSSAPGPGRFVATHLGEGLPASAIDLLPSRSVKNPGYFPFTRQSVTDFDWLMTVDSIA
jgi:erythromycin esterase